MSGKKLYKK